MNQELRVIEKLAQAVLASGVRHVGVRWRQNCVRWWRLRGGIAQRSRGFKNCWRVYPPTLPQGRDLVVFDNQEGLTGREKRVLGTQGGKNAPSDRR
jgi:hypothetical protein